MSAPSRAYINRLVKVQPEASPASTLEPNLTPERVIVLREAKGKGHRATTRVKVLSSEMFNVLEADAVHESGRQHFNNRERRGCIRPTESESVARCQRVSIGTWETHCISAERQICEDKPGNGEDTQKMQWESDQFIVAKKSRNWDGAKGLTVKPKEVGNIHRSLNWNMDANGTLSMTSDFLGQVWLKSRMRVEDSDRVFGLWRESRTSGSVRGFMVNSERRRP